MPWTPTSHITIYVNYILIMFKACYVQGCMVSLLQVPDLHSQVHPHNSGFSAAFPSKPVKIRPTEASGAHKQWCIYLVQVQQLPIKEADKWHSDAAVTHLPGYSISSCSKILKVLKVWSLSFISEPILEFIYKTETLKVTWEYNSTLGTSTRKSRVGRVH